MGKKSESRPIVKLRSTAGTELHLRDLQEPAQPPRPAHVGQVRPDCAPARGPPRGALTHCGCGYCRAIRAFGAITGTSRSAAIRAPMIVRVAGPT